MTTKNKALNILSFLLLVYYLCGFFAFVFVNSHWHIEYRYSENEPKLDLSFLDEADEVNEDSIRKCTELNNQYGTTFDCSTIPLSDLYVPYDKLPLGEKIEATLAEFFRYVAGLFGRDFWSFRGIHIVLAFFALAPLVLLAGIPLLWRLARWALRRAKDPAPAQPHYRVVLGVFAGVVALLVVAVVLVAMQERPTTQTALTDGRVESYRDTVRGLLN